MCLGDIKSRVNDIQIYVDNKKKKGGWGVTSYVDR